MTYRRTDPLYTLDLSDPLQPTKAGELEIEGYSSYLHPVDEDHLMGIGRDGGNALKLTLFDVKDITNPLLADTYTFNNNTYYASEAEYNHKALAFRDSDKLFTLPFNGYMNGYASYLGLFQVADGKFKTYKSLTASPSEIYGGINRGVIFDKNGVTYVAYFVNGNVSYTTLKELP